LRVAIYQGTLRIDRGHPPAMLAIPYIDGIECGAPTAPWFRITDDARWSYRVVDADETRVGCGRDGATVTIRLQIAGQADVVLAALPWKPLPPTQVLTVDLTGKISVTPGIETGPGSDETSQ
jgi:hypothetical protein